MKSKLCIFVAGANDVKTERDRLADIAQRLNRVYSKRGVSLRVLDWRRVPPGPGRPEDVILKELGVDEWDIFVGILWTRFGTPSGRINPETGEPFRSGTEEEYVLACQRWRETGKPKILFYRCLRKRDPRQIDPEQHKLVQVFFDEFRADGEHPGLYQDYRSLREFEQRVYDDLNTLLLEQLATRRPFTLGGQVRNRVTGLGIPGAKITVTDTKGHEYTAVAEEQGGYTFTSTPAAPLAPGPAKVEASAAGYSPITQSPTLVEGVTNTLDLELSPTVLTGGVTDRVTGLPIPGAKVTATESQGRVYTPTADANGGYTLIRTSSEQLALQRQQLTQTEEVLRRLRQPDLEILDLHSLTWLSASREGREIGPREFDVLVDSVVHHAADVQPWPGAVGPPEEAVRALERGLQRYPKLDDRLRLVQGLIGLEVEAATDALLRVALTEDVPEVRAKAAVAAAQRGRVLETMAGLVDGMSGSNPASALAVFAEVANVVGIPEELGPFPRARVLLALGWRRWQANREAIMRRTITAGFGGAVMSLFGCLVPLFVYLAFPDDYYESIATLPLSAWVFSGAMMFLLIGSVHGAASGFALAVADALCHDIAYRSSRLILGIGSGLVLSTLLILLSLWQVASPEVGAAVFIPVYILYGLAFGAASTVVIPQLGTRRSVRQQLRRAAAAMLVTTVTTVPYVFLLYPNMVSETLPHRLSFAVVFPLIMALVFVGRTKEASGRRNPRTKDRGF
jgi:hypothetical protein